MPLQPTTGQSVEQARSLRVAMDQRTITLTDGERRDVWRIDHLRKASQHYGRTWLILFDDAAAAIASCRMSAPTARVLQWCMGALDAREWRTINQRKLAERLEVDRTAVSRALAELQRRGILLREGKAARLSIWVAWRGTAAAYRKERASRKAEIAAAAEWHRANSEPGHDSAVLEPWEADLL